MIRHDVATFVFATLLSTPVAAEPLVALLQSEGKGGTRNALTTFDSADPAVITPLVDITGLGPGAEVLGIDYRPLTGQLYALSSESAIYTLNVATGAATLVGEGFNDELDGTYFGFDFNPVIDRIRIVSDTGQNFVAHPDTGLANVAATTDVFYGPGDANEGETPRVVHHAYDGVVVGELASATQLRAVDSGLDVLVTQANNAGTLGTIGDLTADAGDMGGFDIGASGAAFATFPFGGVTAAGGAGVSGGSISGWRLYTIDLETGVADGAGDIGLPSESLDVAGLAIVPVIPEPSSLLLFALAAVTAAVYRRRL